MENINNKPNQLTKKLLHEGWNTNSLLTVTAVLEKDTEKNIYKRIIYIALSPGGGGSYDTHRQVKMKISTFDLRSLSFALKELAKNGVSNYQKYTDPSKRGNNTQSVKKVLFVAKDSTKSNYFINISSGNDKVGAMFDIYGIMSLSEQLTEIAKRVDDIFYKCQMK